MKNSPVLLPLFFLICFSGRSFAQFQPDLEYFRPNDKRGLNMFEPPKEATEDFERIRIRIGGDFAMQFQALDQTNSGDSLVALGSDFNLPTANLSVDVQLYDGMRMHLRTYLSSRHHEESWVKGGYLQIDELDFINSGFLSAIMDFTRITIGLDEINYGDAHFRRSDNARAVFNPFVENYLMDAFTTEAFGEITFLKNGFIGMIGISNGKLNQNVVVNDKTDNAVSFYGKLGFDKQFSEDLRLRLTGSWYTNQGASTGTSLYGGDRAGARYYYVLHTINQGGSDFEGRINPRFNKLTALQINPFIKFRGLEFFGIYERASNADDLGGGVYTQLAGELLYRFGGREQFYLGGRYNRVDGNQTEDSGDRNVERFNIGGGWFLTQNVLTKAEFVRQAYEGAGYEDTLYQGAEFDGIVLEAVISF